MVQGRREASLLFNLHDLVVSFRVLDTGLIEFVLLDTAPLEIHNAAHIVFEVLGAALVVALVDDRVSDG